MEECRDFITEMERLLLVSVGTDASRWADVVGIMSSLSPRARQRAIELLSQQTDTLQQHSALDNLWSKLRKHLHHHNSYPNAAWVMDQSDLKVLESVYLELTPSDHVAAYAWLFDNWPILHNPPPLDLAKDSTDFSQRDNQVVEARHTAIKAVYEAGGASAVLAVAEVADEPHQVGAAVANCLDSALALDLALNHLGSTALKLRNLSYGILRALFLLSGWTPLDNALLMAKAIGEKTTGACGHIPGSRSEARNLGPA